MPEKVFRQEISWGRAIGIRDRERLRDWNFLRCRSTIKTIHKNHKLAFGSDSVIFMNNIVVQHQRKSTVPAEVPGPVFPSSVPHFSGSDSHLFQIFHSTFPIYSTILFLQGGADYHEINKAKQVRLFLSWKHKNLDSYPIPRAFADICSCTWFWNVCVIQKCQLCLSVSEFAGIPEWI